MPAAVETVPCAIGKGTASAVPPIVIRTRALAPEANRAVRVRARC